MFIDVLGGCDCISAFSSSGHTLSDSGFDGNKNVYSSTMWSE